MSTKIISATTMGIEAYSVDVEVDLSLGMLQFFIVGLPDAAIKESKQRIVTALKNCGVKLPNRKIMVNLAPAGLKKEGTLFDLPIALGILHAAGNMELSKKFLNETIFIGELSLDGSIKPVRGILPIACNASNLKKNRLIIPKDNVKEASLIKDVEVIGVSHLIELIAFLRGELTIKPEKSTFEVYINTKQKHKVDFGQVKGQYQAKRVLQIAAAGRHNVLFVGAPGSGKSMLAQRMPTIMPPMCFEEIIDTTKIYSVSGNLEANDLIVTRPFRSPHHTISQAGLVGGGSIPQPGEISLAHNGILFLDEFTEFKHDTIEALRQPIESKNVIISRAQCTLKYPASFILIAALNPCPCGYYGDKRKKCICSQNRIERYLSKLSGPILDRIDLQVNVPSIDYKTAQNISPKKYLNSNLSSGEIYKKVEIAIKKQQERFSQNLKYNSYMSSDEIDKYCELTFKAQDIIKDIFDKLGLSMRGYHKILKISRTIADLEEMDFIDHNHIREAISYRSLDQSLGR